MRRVAIGIVAAAAAFGVACGVALAVGPPSGWGWLLGDLNTASIGQLSGDVAVYAGAYWGGSVPISLSGKGEILETDVHDGYYEFEHSDASPNTVFLAKTQAGAPTSMTIGTDDGQDVTPLVVSGQAGMPNDLQTWQLGSDGVSAIDSEGRLRINGITLAPTINNGKVGLDAILPDGSTQLLVPARRASS